jgi:hypothetical protein
MGSRSEFAGACGAAAFPLGRPGVLADGWVEEGFFAGRFPDAGVAAAKAAQFLPQKSKFWYFGLF